MLHTVTSLYMLSLHLLIVTSTNSLQKFACKLPTEESPAGFICLGTARYYAFKESQAGAGLNLGRGDMQMCAFISMDVFFFFFIIQYPFVTSMV